MSHLPTRPKPNQVTVLETAVEYLTSDRDQLIAESGAAEVGRLELALEDIGWQRLVVQQHTEFSRAGLERIAILSELMWRKNPLIRRAVNVRTLYCWAQGVTVRARDDALNEVVQGFYADPQNQLAVFGHEAAERLDRTLATRGNLAFVLVTAPASGWVQVRTIPWTELHDPIRNPNDRADTWFWPRRYLDATGAQVEVLHPDVDHVPTGVRPAHHDGVPIRWDQPVLVETCDRLDGDTWGVPEVYAALDWARAYKEFLEDWAGYVKALAEFAWRHKTASRAAAGRVSATHGGQMEYDPVTGQRRAAGATAVGTDVDGLEPVRQTGAHVDATSGRYLAVMVGSAMDVPYSILTGDADHSNLATAQTLDRPMELALTSRRRQWADLYRRLFRYVLDAAVRAPRGSLSGTVGRDEWGRTVVTLPDDVDVTIDVDWPPLVEHDLKDYIEAATKANDTGLMPPDVTLRLLLTSFGVDDVDEHVDNVIDLAAQQATREDAEAVAESAVARILEAEAAKITEAA